MKSGIYSITCTINWKVYVGSAVDIQHRWNGHRTDLKRGGESYTVIDPEGNVYETVHLKSFCRDHDLVYYSVIKVVTGQRKSLRGWIFRKDTSAN